MPVVLFENNLFKLMAHIETTMQLTLNCHSIQIENTVQLTFKLQFNSDWSHGFNIEPYSHKATIQKDLEISPQSDCSQTLGWTAELRNHSGPAPEPAGPSAEMYSNQVELLHYCT